MNGAIPRLRMFAGPNGSGKSTIKSVISPYLLGIYINPDDIEQEIRESGFLDFNNYSVKTNSEVLNFFAHSSLLEKAGLLEDVQHLHFTDDKLIFHEVGVNAYFASVAADFIRQKLIAAKKSFSFETVMSWPDKIEVLRKAQENGYRTCLYYVATDDPAINIARVRYRVKMGGHSVPEDKIMARYESSLNLLIDAIKYTHRAYIFDNSGSEHIWLAEITNGQILEMKMNHMPAWFKKALWDKITQ